MIFYEISDTLIDNCVFDNNFITSGAISGNKNQNKNGGAIYFLGSNMVINNSNFNNNIITNNTEDFACHGGAIFMGGSVKAYSVLIINSLFTNNRAYTGGAITKGMSDVYDFKVINCTFINNTADSEGGAISSKWGKDNSVLATTLIENCTFINNNAGLAGAVAWYGGSNTGTTDYSGWINQVIIRNNLFDSNTGLNSGAVVVTQGRFATIENNLFINNSAQINSAIYGSWITILNIINNTFINNTATENGTIGLFGQYWDYEHICTSTTGTCSYNDEHYDENGQKSNLWRSDRVNTYYHHDCGPDMEDCDDPRHWVHQFNVIGNTFIDNNAIKSSVLNVKGANVNFNYNRIFSESDNLISFTQYNYTWETVDRTINIDFNWWGSNNDPNSKFTGVEANNWFQVNVIPLILDSQVSEFIYTIRLSDDNTDFEVNKLPNFNGFGTTSLGGYETSWIAKLNQNLYLENTANEPGVYNGVYTFNIDNEPFTFEGEYIMPIPKGDDIFPKPDPSDIIDTKNDTAINTLNKNITEDSVDLNNTSNSNNKTGIDSNADNNVKNTVGNEVNKNEFEIASASVDVESANDVNMKKTGMPLLAMLLVLFSLVGIRKFKN